MIENLFNKPNMIYKITKNLDLGGETITLRGNCTLDFQGGSITNGSLILSKTKILPYGSNLSEIISADLSGTFIEGQVIWDPIKKINTVYTQNKWCDANGNPADALKEGDTAHRPSGIKDGFQYFDTDLGKFIWYHKGKWIDANGNEAGKTNEDGTLSAKTTIIKN